MVVNKANVVSEIFEIIYDRISSTVTEVTLSDESTSTIATYTGAFPDKDIDDSSKYPICVINSPELSWEDFTFTKKNVNGTFIIDIYTTKAESADLFLDAIINAIETYRDTLSHTCGLTFVNLESTDYDNAMRGKMKIHRRSATFKFRFIFNKTAGT